MGTVNRTSTLAAFCDKTTMAVLVVLFAHPEEPLHLREVIRRVDKGQGVVQRVLLRLTEAGILIVERKAHLRLYRPDTSCVIYKELRQMIDKTLGISFVLAGVLKPLRPKIKWAFVFGSVASGKEKAGSDVDLAVIGNVSLSQVVDQIRKAETKIGRQVNVTLYSGSEFGKKAVSAGSFVARILEGSKMMIIGDEYELEQLGR